MRTLRTCAAATLVLVLVSLMLAPLVLGLRAQDPTPTAPTPAAPAITAAPATAPAAPGGPWAPILSTALVQIAGMLATHTQTRRRLVRIGRRVEELTECVGLLMQQRDTGAVRAPRAPFASPLFTPDHSTTVTP